MKLKKLFRSRKPCMDTGSGIDMEMERITNQLLKDSVGPHGTMTKMFEKFKKQAAMQETIGEDQFRKMMYALINQAITDRSMLNGRIARSVEKGDTGDWYYDRLADIDHLTMAAQQQMERMKTCERRVDDLQQLYNITHEHIFDETYKEAMGSSGREKQKQDAWKDIFSGDSKDDTV